MFATDSHHRSFGWKTLIPFLFITFFITWGVLGFYIFFNELAVSTFGQISGTHPFFFLAVWSPAIAAVAIISYRTGLDGLKRFLYRLFRFRAPAGWLIFLLFGLPAVFFLGALIKGEPLMAPVLAQGTTALLTAVLLMMFLGPIEELGWRGLALPILQRYMAPAWAAIIIGTVWGIWHLPAFLLSGTVQSEWAFAPFLLGNICLSVIVTPIFNASRGSILLPMFFHFQVNNPIWPDAQPYDTYLLCGVALIILLIQRKTMFSIAAGCKEVIPCKEQPK